MHGRMQILGIYESQTMLQKTSAPNDIDAVLTFMEEEVFLRLSIVDVQNYDDTLVVMTGSDVPRVFVRMLLKKVWSGPVEVYCASGLMAGSNVSLT